MPMNAAWDNAEQTVIRQDYVGKWTWEEYFEMTKKTRDMISSMSHVVDVISDMKPGIIPRQGSAITFARKALSSLPPNRGIIVVVTNPLVAALLRVFKNLDKEIGPFMYAVNSVEEARKLIAEHQKKREIT